LGYLYYSPKIAIMHNKIVLLKWWLSCALLFVVLWTNSAAPPIHMYPTGNEPAVEANIPCPSFTGPATSCVGKLETYLTAPVSGASYTWSLSGGGSLSNTTGASTMVNWTASGTYVVTLTTTGAGASVCTKTVNVSPIPTPFIQTNFVSDCQEDKHGGANLNIIPPQGGSQECWVVCEQTTVNYWTNAVAGNTYSWVVVGGTPTTGTGPSISVTWGPSGTGSIFVTETAPGGCSKTVEECIDIVDAPKADLSIDAVPYTGPVVVCLGQDLNFSDMSTGANSWYWDFGDGTTSIDNDPLHEYTVAGTYYGSLTVKNECGCTDVFYFTIKVTNLAAPEIGCVSTVCLNECAFYSITNMGGCTSGNVNWTVQGGSIIGSVSASTVEVRWDDNDGFIAQNGYGSICATVSNCPNLCDGTVCANVPVIHDVKITGPLVVCVGDPVTYSVPSQPGINEVSSAPNGVDFDWVVTGGNIISSWPYSNQITVIWNSAGTYSVDLDVYNNPNTAQECQFDPAPVSVVVKPNFTVLPQTASICLGSSQTFNATGVGAFNWTVVGPSGTTGPTAGTAAFTVTPSVAGTHVVYAQSTSGQYCDASPSAVLKVQAPPPAPVGSLTGALSVCLNTPYIYTFSTAPLSGSVLVWTATGGTVYGGAGQSVTVQWTSAGPKTLTVQAMSTTAPFCLSAPLNFAINTYVPPTNFVFGPANACVNETKIFNVTGLANYTNLQWNVIPATAGSVVGGQNSTSASILFNTSAPPVVTISCTATVCNSTVTSSITVNITQIPSYAVAPISVCQGSTVVPALLPSAAGVSSYNWNFGDGSPTSSAAAPPHAWANAGSFPITVQLGLNICGNPTVAAAGTVNVYPVPVVNVTASNGYVVCPPSTPSTNLVASTQFTCTYLWSTGATGSTINVTTPGTYTVTATSTQPGSCTSTSSVIVVGCGNCNSSCTSTTPPWFFTATENCDTYTFTPVIGGSTATFVFWDFGDGTPFNTTAGSGAVTHTYAHPGYYYVRLRTYDPVSGCFMTVQMQVIVKFKGNFSYTFNCSGGSMQTILTDQSEYLPGLIVAKTWYKTGYGILGTGNSITVSSAIMGAGSHNIYLSVLINGTQTCQTPTQAVVVPALPVAAFTSNAPKCEGVPITFNSTSSGGLSYSWAFGDGATSGVINPTRTYVAPPTSYTVTLTANSAWGCASTATATIGVHNSGTVASPGYTISPSAQQCQGTPITITANTGLTVVSYDWYNSTAPNTSLGNSNSLVPTVSGTYGVRFLDNNQCPYNILAAPIVYTPLPVVQIVGNNSYCRGEPIQLSAELGSTSGITYLWNITTPSSGTVSFSSPSISLSTIGFGAGTYICSVTITANGCSNTGSMTVVVHPGVLGLSISSNSVCEPATLTASGTNAVTYNWSTGTNGPSTYVPQGGYYSVIATDAFGCTAEQNYDLEGKPDLSNIMTGCYDFCEKIEWQAINCAGCSYQWYQNGVAIPSANAATYWILTSGVYTVVVTNSVGCSSSSDPIDVSIASDPSLCDVCHVGIEETSFECIGVDPLTGIPIYEFNLFAFNGGGALSGLTVINSSWGTMIIDSPSNGFLPGGGAATNIHGYLYWNGGPTDGCVTFMGYLTGDCNNIKECIFEWCGTLPKCCDLPCRLEDGGATATCIGNGLYEVQVTVINSGCKLFNGFVKHNSNIYALNPSTIVQGTATYTFIAQGFPGPNYFTVFGYTFDGHLCSVESKAGFPECPPAGCGLDAEITISECIGLDPNNNPIYQFSAYVYGIAPGASFYTVSSPGYVTSLSYSYSATGNYHHLVGTYVSAGANTQVCFTIVAVNGADVCSGFICTSTPGCSGNKQATERSDDAAKTISNLVSPDAFTLMPNPAQDLVKVITGTSNLGYTQIRLVDVMGKVQAEVVPIGSTTDLDISRFAPGMYHVIVIDYKGTAHAKKLVIAGRD
jgi:PKD repeat protein